MRKYFETETIKEVNTTEDYHYITSETNTGFGLETKYGVVPKVGDVATVYTKNGFGSVIRGIALNGVDVFFKSDEDLEAERVQWLKENEERKQREYEENKEKYALSYSKLPQVFKDRLDRFRKESEEKGENFDIDGYAYELFCCEEAVKIAEALKQPNKVQDFKDKPYELQKKMVPALDDGHSGNTFYGACALAYHYLKGDKL